ncbi:MAG TPA: hypothetical protein VMZ28_02480 [Kofleriaceae bacterium]|nr:hypothetical protein [Kofleriaceae bacterium]
MGWLVAQGIPEAQLAAYRQGAEKILAATDGAAFLPKHVDVAMKREEAAGASPRVLANLHKIGETMVEYGRVAPPPLAAPGAPTDPNDTPKVTCGTCQRAQPYLRSGLCMVCGAALLAPTGPGGPCYVRDGERHCRACNGRFEFYDGLSAGSAGGGAASFGGIVAAYMFGLLGAITVASGIAAIGTLAACLSLKFRCTSCWTRLPTKYLEAEERSAMVKQRLVFLACAIVLGLVCLGCGIAWIAIAGKTRRFGGGFRYR